MRIVNIVIGLVYVSVIDLCDYFDVAVKTSALKCRFNTCFFPLQREQLQ